MTRATNPSLLCQTSQGVRSHVVEEQHPNVGLRKSGVGIKGARRCQGDAARYDAAATKTRGSQGEKGDGKQQEEQSENQQKKGKSEIRHR